MASASASGRASASASGRASAFDPSACLSSLFGRFPKPTNDIQAAIYSSQQAILVRQLFIVGLINMLSSSLIAVTMQPKFGMTLSLIWMFPLFVIGIFQILIWNRFRGTPLPDKVSGKFLRRGEWVALCVGSWWGGSALLFGDSDDVAHLVFLYLVLTGMSAGLSNLITPLPRHTVRFSLPCLLPVILSALVYQNSYLLPVSALGLLFLGTLADSSMYSYKQLQESITKTWENHSAKNNFIDAIESTNDAFALYDADKKLFLANKRHLALFGDGGMPIMDKQDGATVETLQHAGRWLLRSRHKTRLGGVVVIHTDVTALKMREHELLETRKEAEEADAAKTRFLSTMSHELRTPLNIILSFSRLMASDSQVRLTWEEVAEYADSINESGVHLLKLIDDIIEYSKVGMNKILLALSDVDVEPMLDRIIPLAASFENVQDTSLIKVNISDKIGSLRVDESIFQRVIMNLLSNAMRFAIDNPQINIHVDLDEQERPCVTIQDFSGGIPETDMERVFEAFYQHNNTQDCGFGGAGLGLTLCRHLARLHDGDVTLESHMGEGTTAKFILPKSAYIPRTDGVESQSMIA